MPSKPMRKERGIDTKVEELWRLRTSQVLDSVVYKGTIFIGYW